MYYKDDPRYNASGCKDMTAYEAIENINSEARLRRLLAEIFRSCDKAGFHLEERIVLRDKKTGKIWR